MLEQTHRSGIKIRINSLLLVTKPFSHGLDASQDTEIGSQPGLIYNSSMAPWKPQLFLAVTLELRKDPLKVD